MNLVKVDGANYVACDCACRINLADQKSAQLGAHKRLTD